MKQKQQRNGGHLFDVFTYSTDPLSVASLFDETKTTKKWGASL